MVLAEAGWLAGKDSDRGRFIWPICIDFSSRWNHLCLYVFTIILIRSSLFVDDYLIMLVMWQSSVRKTSLWGVSPGSNGSTETGCRGASFDQFEPGERYEAYHSIRKPEGLESAWRTFKSYSCMKFERKKVCRVERILRVPAFPCSPISRPGLARTKNWTDKRIRLCNIALLAGGSCAQSCNAQNQATSTQCSGCNP